MATPNSEPDFRSKRITAYLDLLNMTVARQFADLRQQPSGEQDDLQGYFDPSPSQSERANRQLYVRAPGTSADQNGQEAAPRRDMLAGDADNNMMSKVDKINRSIPG